ncbi:ATP-binding cassette domain-containing protein [Spiroplasma endosymbiont of Othius punctulatus]|uniref:ATP-binding cassette domain-containing protein n=1 Tax=Spiroplasma endosymbiont of Othius punctulatus TaxID=3066289 RepID=UPI0030CB0632
MKKIIKVDDVKKQFNGWYALRGVTTNFEAGKVYGFLGNNGAGKTTLTKLIFQNFDYDGGNVTLNDKELKDVDYSEWFYFSESADLPVDTQVKEYIGRCYDYAQRPGKEYKTKVDKVMKIINIKKWWNKKIKSLSAGQKKMVVLFLCLLLRPKIVFFDEPTANVDINNKELILKTIKTLKSEDTIVVVITHLIEEVEDILDHIVIMSDGLIKYDEPLESGQSVTELFEKYAVDNSTQSERIKEYIEHVK